MSNNEPPSMSRYKQDLEAMRAAGAANDDKGWIDENGKRVRMPYKMIKQVVFTEVSKTDMLDQQHAAKLQYDLLLLDPVIKAWVEFVKGRITVIYNPAGADNIREKMSLDELVKFLADHGVHVSKDRMEERDYDYYKEFYSYAFNPAVIREHAPYGYTEQQWKKMKPEWERKMEEVRKKKWLSFLQYQKDYEKLHPEVYGQQAQQSQ